MLNIISSIPMHTRLEYHSAAPSRNWFPGIPIVMHHEEIEPHQVAFPKKRDMKNSSMYLFDHDHDQVWMAMISSGYSHQRFMQRLDPDVTNLTKLFDCKPKIFPDAGSIHINMSKNVINEIIDVIGAPDSEGSWFFRHLKERLVPSTLIVTNQGSILYTRLA
jgi:hypothetical protein